ncbi:MAG: transcriptional regulator [Verrucomicrobia bacterium]|nr:MAG: transcriptional regulator [Verrucomicrobiota bacterium]
MEKTIYSDDYAKLRQWLRERRNEKNLTMRELAERMDVIHSWIGKIELGERRLDIIEYIQYCKALEVDPIEGIKLIA